MSISFQDLGRMWLILLDALLPSFWNDFKFNWWAPPPHSRWSFPAQLSLQLAEKFLKRVGT
ncbi:hypothetical protein EW026_g7719 [Hermanssonia centrifuga]|uniref:Uncharacterized protein n=1 Tax=Hermanssonia centrifuga TaxID=98765 RepID=A0A4S4K6U1_9APHY|nr:hypothetical protein EW026_g7719 [Hermanssonia centrifuga]